MGILSELPGHIIQHIVDLMRLTKNETNELMFLSKDFYIAVRNRHTLVFNGLVVGEEESCREKLKCLHNTLTRYNQENIKLETFQFRVQCLLASGLHYECIDLVTKLSPKNIYLQLQGFLPQSVFGVESVVHLCLRDCLVKKPEGIQWPNLKRLRLEYVKISKEDEGVFEMMMRSSPLLETLEIKCAHGQLFRLENCCQNLRILHLSGMWPGGEFFRKFEQNFPQLEDFSINFNDSEYDGSVIMSSKSLKSLRLQSIGNLREARFHVPNVVSNGFNVNHILSETAGNGIKIERYDAARHRIKLAGRVCGVLPEVGVTYQVDANNGTIFLQKKRYLSAYERSEFIFLRDAAS